MTQHQVRICSQHWCTYHGLLRSVQNRNENHYLQKCSPFFKTFFFWESGFQQCTKITADLGLSKKYDIIMSLLCNWNCAIRSIRTNLKHFDEHVWSYCIFSQFLPLLSPTKWCVTELLIKILYRHLRHWYTTEVSQRWKIVFTCYSVWMSFRMKYLRKNIHLLFSVTPNERRLLSVNLNALIHLNHKNFWPHRPICL